MGYLEKICKWLISRDAIKIRSEIIPIVGVNEFTYNADVLKPYSFTLVNTGAKDFLINGIIAVESPSNMDQNILDFPRVGTFKRNDIIIIKGGAGPGNLEGFIRADYELTG